MRDLRYQSEQMPDVFSEVKLLYISTSKYEGDWNSGLHAHHCTELFYVLSGAGGFQIEDMVFPVVPDDIIIVNPHVKHTETAQAQAPMEFIAIGIEGGEFLLRDSIDERFCTMRIQNSPDVLALIRQILREMEHREPHHSLAAQCYLKLLLIRLLRLRPLSLAEPKGNNTGKSTECSQVKRYIDTHFQERITLEALADIAHLNKYYLVHAFTREFNISPIHYLNKRRVKESCYYLTKTDYSISQIAQILGFSSLSYFSQSFGKSIGMSPREYRQQHQKKGAAETAP